LRSPYPAGDGSAAILGSMPPNNRRVRIVLVSGLMVVAWMIAAH
jgi:hypothetical protein